MHLHTSDTGALLATVLLLLHHEIEFVHRILPCSVLLLIVAQRFQQTNHYDSTIMIQRFHCFFIITFYLLVLNLSTIKTSLYSDNNNDCKGIAKNTLKHHKEYCFVCFASCEYLIWGCCSESSIRVLPDSHRPKILDFIQVFFICSCKFSTKNRLCEEYMHLFLLFY